MKSKWIKYNNTIFMRKWNITLFPFIFLVGKNDVDIINRIGQQRFKKLVNHESIHRKQQKEVFILGVLLAAIVAITTSSLILTILTHFIYYVIYILNYFINIFKYKNNAYKNIAMEREAYSNSDNDNYLTERKLFAWIKYINK